MSGQGDGRWSVETLKEHLDARISDLKTHVDQRFVDQEKAVSAALAAAEKAVVAALASAEKAIDKAEVNSEKWRANANEWRAAMGDREIKFAMRAEVASEVKALEATIGSLEKSRDQGTGGRGALEAGRLWILAAVTIAGFALMVAWKLMAK
jgi:uncharacterized protein YfaS (alpha-2-macroglobulin family)